MFISKQLKEKVIIIAESDQQLRAEIKLNLNKHGFLNIKIALGGMQVYEILRSYYDAAEKIGLLIVNAQLPQCNVLEMCKVLSSNETSLIPFVILGADDQKDNIENSEFNAQALIRRMLLPINYSVLLDAVGFQLIMMHERHLRRKQEELLITELAERKIVDAKLKYLVGHDELTGLMNRRNFEGQLRLILGRSPMRKQEGALIFINLDRFSLVNELEGFDVGDRLLVEVVTIIRKLTCKSDLFARIGSDEFCLFLENKAAQEIKQFAEHLRKTVYQLKFSSGDVCYNTSLSIGIASVNTVTVDYHPNEVISRARQACRMAKEHGRNMVWSYNEADTKVQERNKDLYWVPLIKKALLEKNFFLVFQPVVHLSSGIVSHYEVLIRMRGLDNEVISPAEFIPVAERMGLIHSIDQWVVENAIDFLAKLPETSKISLAINLSSFAFQDDSLLPLLKEKLLLTWVNASRLTFEITETAAVENFEQTRQMIAEIRSLGCKFALDDFGAGFCSFNYLKTFPVDFVKIDGQFIRNLIYDETDQVLVKSMAEIATNLGKKTIAEFVETPEVIAKLKELGIDMAQGYIFGKPEQELLVTNSIALDGLIRESAKPKRFASWFGEKISRIESD
ncbi:MAG: EAL domain-containing protein [Methyloprofundus sp.]|nr:EAL domain-containing protein [Methyloprofundus sp.]MDT8424756.1 EAL domain-containing protein [Methyloprofundus sp.]